MATLTVVKRDARPVYYTRKDARTRIYRELYGNQGRERGYKTNHPETDETRQFNSFWSHQQAEHIYKTNMDAAGFTAIERINLEKRLDVLKQFKPKGVIG